MLNLGDILVDKQTHWELPHCMVYIAAAEASHDMNGNAAIDVNESTSFQMEFTFAHSLVLEPT